MNFIFLPGNSPQNKSWIEKVHKEFSMFYEEGKILEYKHWESGENILDFEEESKRLIKMSENLEPFCILAKSAGCLLALKLISEDKIKPEKCFFMGFPYGFGRNIGLDIDSMFEKYKTPTLFLQKTQDPAMASTKLKDYLLTKDIPNYEMHEIPGSKHHYGDIDLLKDLWSDFISK